MKTIADRIEQMLAERRLTKAALARKAGMTKSTLQSIMDTPNRSPRAATIQKLADALAVDHTWLATGKHSKGKDLNEGNGHAPLTPDEHNHIAQALEDALAEKGIKIGAAEKAKLIAGFLEKLGRK